MQHQQEFFIKEEALNTKHEKRRMYKIIQKFF